MSECTVRITKYYQLFTDPKSPDLYLNFPEIWALVDNDVHKLSTIAEFFCAMRELQSRASKQLFDLLMARLSARSKKEVLPTAPKSLVKEITDIANVHVNEVKKLGGLMLPAFQLFAAGALCSRRGQNLTRENKNQKKTLGHLRMRNMDEPEPGELIDEPDGAAYFFWAEFAFLAAKHDKNYSFWNPLISVLVRTEKIFSLCYGGSKDGVIPSTNSFSTYPSDDFEAIFLKDVTKLSAEICLDIETLKTEAYNSIRFAFPAGV